MERNETSGAHDAGEICAVCAGRAPAFLTKPKEASQGFTKKILDPFPILIRRRAGRFVTLCSLPLAWLGDAQK
jgi:hypothetical protein